MPKAITWTSSFEGYMMIRWRALSRWSLRVIIMLEVIWWNMRTLLRWSLWTVNHEWMILPVRKVGIELLGQLKRRHTNWIKKLICFNHASYILWDLILAYSGIGFAFQKCGLYSVFLWICIRRNSDAEVWDKSERALLLSMLFASNMIAQRFNWRKKLALLILSDQGHFFTFGYISHSHLVLNNQSRNIPLPKN